MIITSLDLLHIILAVSVILFFAHSLGYLFEKIGQPRVIGEIAGGLLLGSSFLKYFWPQIFDFLFSENTNTTIVLNTFYQLGVLHMFFCVGMELQLLPQKGEKFKWRSLSIPIFSISIPLAFSFFFINFFSIKDYIGTANSPTAFAFIFSIALAITSIGLISRMLYDLKILNTPFAKVIISSAIIEDAMLYVLLTLAIGSVKTRQTGIHFGLDMLLGLEDSVAYHIMITLLFFVIMFVVGPFLFKWLNKIHFTIYQRINPLSFLVAFMLMMSGLALVLNIVPIFGALMGGIIAQNFPREFKKVKYAFETYSFAFFIPIYFAMIGIKLDFIHAFDPLFFIIFIVIAYIIKGIGVYIGAIVSGEKQWNALNLSIVMNERGGSITMIAALAYDMNIINEVFYCSVVILAITSTLFSGSWLRYIATRNLIS